MRTGFHIDSRYTMHVTPAAHPERPDRIGRLLDLSDRAGEIGVELVPSKRAASRLELERVHTAEHVDAIAATRGRDRVTLDPDTFTSGESWETACRAAGGVLDVVDAVAAGALDNGFAAVRPPGHHAESDRAMGFCLFNNVAVAARHLIDRHAVERVAIVDWDVHHGNGTQQIFYHDPRVLFVSIHQFPFYPGTGSIEETGGGDGRGYTVNIPMPGGCGDADYLAAFDRVVVPVVEHFDPQFVLVSAGFDGHALDSISAMRLSETAFGAMASRLVATRRSNAVRRCVGVLEGGYHLDALYASVEVVLRAMAAPETGALADTAEASGTEDLLDAVVAVHRENWDL